MNIHAICECFFKLIINLPFNLYICQQAWAVHIYKNQITTFIRKFTMIKYTPLIILLLLLSNNIAVSQNNDWKPSSPPFPSNMSTKFDGNIKYTVSPSISADKRNKVIINTQKYIIQNLELIQESMFNDSVHILIVKNRDEMKKYFGVPFAGLTGLKDEYIKENLIYCVYDENYDPLKHEIMHIISFIKWGGPHGVPGWLVEGLPTFAGQVFFDCDCLTLEERYVYLLQTGRLLDIKKLMGFPKLGEASNESKAGYNQSGFLVKYLLDNYGVEKLRELWMNSAEEYEKTERQVSQMITEQNIAINNAEAMLELFETHSLATFLPVFEKLYGISFDNMIEKINGELKQKYPYTINYEWEEFGKSCIE